MLRTAEERKITDKGKKYLCTKQKRPMFSTHEYGMLHMRTSTPCRLSVTAYSIY